MDWDQIGQTYQRATVQSATTVGLVIALYDRLAADLGRAAAAIRKGDVETRCKELNHALLVLQHQDGLLDMKNGGETAQALASFHSWVRLRMLDAQVKLDPAILDKQIDIVLELRQAWDEVESRSQTPQSMPAAVVTGAYGSGGELGSSNWSA